MTPQGAVVLALVASLVVLSLSCNAFTAYALYRLWKSTVNIAQSQTAVNDAQVNFNQCVQRFMEAATEIFKRGGKTDGQRSASLPHDGAGHS